MTRVYPLADISLSLHEFDSQGDLALRLKQILTQYPGLPKSLTRDPKEASLEMIVYGLDKITAELNLAPVFRDKDVPPQHQERVAAITQGIQEYAHTPAGKDTWKNLTYHEIMDEAASKFLQERGLITERDVLSVRYTGRNPEG